MKKTGKKIWLVCKDMGWNMARVIYENEQGREYVKINGSYIELNWCIGKCDDYSIDNEF